MIDINYLTDKFALLVANNPKKNITQCYNYFIDNVTSEEAIIVTKYYLFFIKIGESIRNSYDEIKEKYIKKEFNSFFRKEEAFDR